MENANSFSLAIKPGFFTGVGVVKDRHGNIKYDRPEQSEIAQEQQNGVE